MWPFRRSAKPPLGKLGEGLASAHLKRCGLKILARNYRCPVGEVDIIAFDASTVDQLGAETIAFVEVKTRSSDRHTDPSSAVDGDKRRRMRKIAEYYIANRDPSGRYNARFDVVSIVIRDGQQPELEYTPEAF